MQPGPIYFDNQATTRVDPRVVEAMLPFFTETYGNASSTTHPYGWAAAEALKSARTTLAAAIGARPKEVVLTSGATESNNLAIRGVADYAHRRGNHIVSVATEHPAVLDPLEKLSRRGFDVTLLPVTPAPDPLAGCISVDQVADALREDTILVSVMQANNEIGAIQPLEEIGRLCKERAILLHTDATQAVGKIPVDVERLQVDLLSFSAHKIYGPKGIGALYVRRKKPFVRLEPLILGGGHEAGLRSGTANVPSAVGFARAVELCLEEMPEEDARLRTMRDRLWEGIAAIPDVHLNGPALSEPDRRLAGNLSVGFDSVDGESLLMSMGRVAASSGSACTSAKPEPSHVLRALGLSDEASRGSVRFGLGRFNTPDEVETVIETVVEAVSRLRRMGSLPVLRGE